MHIGYGLSFGISGVKNVVSNSVQGTISLITIFALCLECEVVGTMSGSMSITSDDNDYLVTFNIYDFTSFFGTNKD